MPARIWTIGHSTRPIEEFLGLLIGARVKVVADVRSFPGSRKYPQYGKEALAATLATHSIGYHWLQALGGRRRVSPDSGMLLSFLSVPARLDVDPWEEAAPTVHSFRRASKPHSMRLG